MKPLGVLKWKNKSVANEIVSARTIVAAVIASGNFKSPNPATDDITVAVDNLEAAQQELDSNGGGTKFSTARNGCRALLKNLMTQLVLYINNIADGDADIIKSAALDLKRAPVRKGKLGATDRINAEGIDESTVKVNWKSVSGAATYHVQMSHDVSPLAWQEFAGNLVTEAKAEVSNLPTGDKLWFRVIAINAAGEGAPSNPAVVRVP